MHAIIPFRERCKDKPTSIVAEVMMKMIGDNIENIVAFIKQHPGLCENNQIKPYGLGIAQHRSAAYGPN